MMTADEPPEQDDIRQQLSSQPSPPIPDSVSERIAAVLREEQQQRETDAPRRNRWWIPLGAAAAIALLVGIIVIPGEDTPDPQPIAAGCQTQIDGESDLGAVTQQSGRDYTQAELADQAQDLLASSPPCPKASTTVVPTETTTAPAPSPIAADISNCLLEVIPNQDVLALDIANFEGEELLVAIVSNDPAEAIVVECGSSPIVVHRTDLN